MPAVTSPEAYREQVDQLLPGLAADDVVTRTTSRAKLMDLGPDILPYLPDLVTVSDPGQREAIRRLANALERLHAKESLRPSIVSLEQSASLADVLRDVTRQTKNRFDISRITAGRLQQTREIRLHEATFWETVEAICRAWHVHPATCTADGLQLQESMPSNDRSFGRIIQDGAFQIEVEMIRRRPIVGRDEAHLLRAPMTVLCEPRLRPLLMTFAVSDFRMAVANTGLLKAYDPQAQLELSFGSSDRAIRWTLDAVIAADAEDAQMTIDGAVNVLLAAGELPLVFPALPESAGVERSRGGVAVRILNVTEEAGRDGQNRAVVVTADVTYERGGPGFESHQTWSLHNDVRLRSTDPTAADLLPNGGMTTERAHNGALRLKYRFQGLTRPCENYQFVYIAPTSVAFHRVPLRLEHLRLPKLPMP